MWIGALTGVAISIVIGVVFIVLFYVAGSKIFTGNSQVGGQGTVCSRPWLAAARMHWWLCRFDLRLGSVPPSQYPRSILSIYY